MAARSPACSSLPAFRALLQIRAVRKKPGALSPVSFSPVLAQSVDHDEHSVSNPLPSTQNLGAGLSLGRQRARAQVAWPAGPSGELGPSLPWVSYMKVQKCGRLKTPGWANGGDSLTCTHTCVAAHSDEVPWHWDSQRGNRKASLCQPPSVIGIWQAAERARDGKCSAAGLRAKSHVSGVLRAEAHCLSSAIAQLALSRHELGVRRGRSATRSSYSP